MIKITLALLAVGATATHVSQSSQDEDWCYGEWFYHDCDGLWYKHNYCSPVCGSYYAETNDAPMNDEHWVSCDDLDWGWCWFEDWTIDGCLSDWIWEDCSSLYYRWDDCSDDCGWEYKAEGDEDEDAYWVTCDEFDSWEEC